MSWVPEYLLLVGGVLVVLACMRLYFTDLEVTRLRREVDQLKQGRKHWP